MSFVIKNNTSDSRSVISAKVLSLYLTQKVVVDWRYYQEVLPLDNNLIHLHEVGEVECTLILKKLEDLSDEEIKDTVSSLVHPDGEGIEAIEWAKNLLDSIVSKAKSMEKSIPLPITGKGVDVFNLIDQGLAYRWTSDINSYLQQNKTTKTMDNQISPTSPGELNSNQSSGGKLLVRQNVAGLDTVELFDLRVENPEPPAFGEPVLVYSDDGQVALAKLQSTTTVETKDYKSVRFEFYQCLEHSYDPVFFTVSYWSYIPFRNCSLFINGLQA